MSKFDPTLGNKYLLLLSLARNILLMPEQKPSQEQLTRLKTSVANVLDFIGENYEYEAKQGLDS